MSGERIDQLLKGPRNCEFIHSAYEDKDEDGNPIGARLQFSKITDASLTPEDAEDDGDITVSCDEQAQGKTSIAISGGIFTDKTAANKLLARASFYYVIYHISDPTKPLFDEKIEVPKQPSIKFSGGKEGKPTFDFAGTTVDVVDYTPFFEQL